MSITYALGRHLRAADMFSLASLSCLAPSFAYESLTDSESIQPIKWWNKNTQITSVTRYRFNRSLADASCWSSGNWIGL
ncbi:hypothetical protein ACVIGV_005139 [Rhizobium leguminosarum]|jgi:hypothetical protein